MELDFLSHDSYSHLRIQLIALIGFKKSSFFLSLLCKSLLCVEELILFFSSSEALAESS